MNQQFAPACARQVDLDEIDSGIAALSLFLQILLPAIARQFVGWREKLDDGDDPAAGRKIDDLDVPLGNRFGLDMQNQRLHDGNSAGGPNRLARETVRDDAN